MPASYPTSAKTFATITNTTTSDAAQINEPREEITAIEQDLIAGLPVARGGTGLTTLTANRIPYGNGTSALQSSASLAFDGSTFTTAAIVATTVTPSGLVDVSGAAAGQVKFPAAQNASTNANTLDDYEEGTFTPTDASGAGLSLTASGWYVKVGKMVTAWMSVTYPATADGTNASIGSLPFTSGTGERWMGYVANTDLGAAVTIMGGTATTQINVWNTSGAAQTNATLSGKSFSIMAMCRASA